MSTLLQLVNEVLRRVGQMETTSLSNAQTPIVQTVDFLNETYFEMLQRLKAQRLLKKATFNTANATAGYALASDAEINSLVADSVIETGASKRLSEVDYSYPLSQGLTATSKPNHFYRSGDLLYLYPIPNGIYTIQYHYQIKPVALSANNDTPQMPVEWEKVLILGVQARLEKFLGESDGDTYLLYRDGLSQLKSRSARKPHHRMKGFYRGNA